MKWRVIAMFDKVFVDDNKPSRQRCDGCEYRHIVHASGGFSLKAEE